jgi:hypothetical protein
MTDVEEHEDNGRAASDTAGELAKKNQHRAAGDAYNRAGDNYEQAAKEEAGEADRAGDGTRAGCIYRCRSAALWELAAQARGNAAAQLKLVPDSSAADKAESFAAGDYEEAAKAFEKCAACESRRDHHKVAAEKYESAQRCWGKVKAIYRAWAKERDEAADHAKGAAKEEAENAASSHSKKAKEAEAKEKAAGKKAEEEKKD